MALNEQLSNLYAATKANAPAPVFEIITTALSNFQNSFDPAKVIQVGTKLPDFRLSDALGKEISSSDLLKQGPLLISFYRGEWCPFCNLELAALQKHLPEFQGKGVTLVAISPELPNQSLTTTEKHALKFPVLSDVGNKYARQLGISWVQPDSMRPLLDKYELSKRNGDDSYEIPIPATLLVDKNGVVRKTFIDPDYTKRLEPSTVLEWIDEL
ncbi:thioredoxin-like protein [Xylogone sp. PMI_703]|nr:thioredoxin-like protein [Xylogone sp. PMI_703]